MTIEGDAATPQRPPVERHAFALAFAVAMLIAVTLPFALVERLGYPASQATASVVGALIGGLVFKVRGARR